MRFLTVSMDKYAIAYAEKRRANRNAKAAETVEVEAAPAPKAEEVNEESNKEEVAE